MRYTIERPNQLRIEVLKGDIKDTFLKVSTLYPNEVIDLRVSGVIRMTACNGEIEHDFVDHIWQCSALSLSDHIKQEIISAWTDVRFGNFKRLTSFERISLSTLPWYLRPEDSKKAQ